MLFSNIILETSNVYKGISPKIYRKVYIWSKQIAGWIVCSFALNFNDTLSSLFLKEETAF